jgi:two-component system, chemotaxis family, protein-glutamate methylesterase/glutaminase
VKLRPNLTESVSSRSPFDVVAVAASAGGLSALTTLLTALPADFPAAILVVQHLTPHHRSWMAEILGRHTRLKVLQASGGEELHPGVVFVAPPDHHLVVSPGGTLVLSQAALVHFVRPSGDLLFESVAAHFKARAIAVVLTGTGTDGAAGVRAIKRAGGTVIAQDAADAEFSGMPAAAIQTGNVDTVLRLAEIAPALVELVRARVTP